MKQYIIGVDIGTGSTKAVAINYAGEVLAVSQFYYPVIDGIPGNAEQDPEIIWRAFVNSIKEIKKKLSGSPSVISLSSCMHSLLLIDNDDKPITNLITWADTRSEEIANKIRSSPDAESIYRFTGTPLHSMSPLCKIIWFKKNAPEIFKRSARFISIKEFIWYKLFNQYQVDYSIASATGLFNIQTFKWHPLSMDLCGISENKLSEIVPVNLLRKDVNQSIASLLEIPDDISFCIGSSDGCLANIGSYANSPETAAVTIGTSGAVRVINSSPVYNYPAMTFNYVLDEKTFVCGGPINNGGNVIQWLFKSFLKKEDPADSDYADLFKTIDTVSVASDGLLFLPYLHGERAPVWDEKSCGVFFGIKSYHTNKHFLRAGLEGICYCLNNILQLIETSNGVIQQLNVSGGFVNSNTWIKILADVTGKKISITQTEDASAIGAALLGLKAVNIIDDYSSLKHNDYMAIESDAANHYVYKKYFSVFKNLYSSLKDSMHLLHDINTNVRLSME